MSLMLLGAGPTSTGVSEPPEEGEAPNAPSNLVIVNEVSNFVLNPEPIQLQWEDNSNNEKGFEIWRNRVNPNSEQNWELLDTVEADITVYEDTFPVNNGAVAESNFYYRVRAINSNGESVFTDYVGTIYHWNE